LGFSLLQEQEGLGPLRQSRQWLLTAGGL